MENSIIAVLVMAGAFVASLFSQEQKPELQEPADSIPTYTELDELVVTGKEDLVKGDAAKLTYNLEGDPTSKGQNMSDALRKVPGVTVDAEGNVKLKGSSNFKIYVNGKEDPMLTQNATQMLKAMPSESVSKIEVISEPGAKYDAEGTGGILNLVTQRKQTNEGYTANANINFNNQNSGAGLYGRMKYGKVTADAAVNYANSLLPFQKGENESLSETYNYDDPEAYRRVCNIKQKFGFQYVGPQFNLSCDITPKDLVTASASYFWMRATPSDISSVSSIYNKSGSLVSMYRQSLSGKIAKDCVNASASYSHLFNDKGHKITGAYQFNYGHSIFDLMTRTGETQGAVALPVFDSNSTSGYTREHTATIDYAVPFSDSKHLLEAGAKGIFRHNTSFGERLTGETEGQLTPIESARTNELQLQNVYALYGEYTGTFGKLKTVAGLRYEHTYMGMRFRLGQATDYDRHLNDVVPDVAVTYSFSPVNSLRLAYNMRITRPYLGQMSPYRMQITPDEIHVGNPDLESERVNKISLSYSNYAQVLGGNVALSFSHWGNSIEQYTYYEGNVAVNTYGNIGKRYDISLEGYLNWNINSKMSVNVNGAVTYNNMHSNSGIYGGNHGWEGRYGLGWDYRGPWGLNFSANGGQSTGSISLQGKYSGWYYYSVGVSKHFLKDDALTLTVNASNFLQSRYHGHTTTSTPGHYERTDFYSRNWSVGVSLSWRFGKLSDQVKRTDANISNDDLKGNSGGTGSTGGIGL